MNTPNLNTPMPTTDSGTAGQVPPTTFQEVKTTQNGALGTGMSDEQLWATAAHAATFVGLLVPVGNIMVPLAIYLIKKQESAFIAEHAKESLNFQISLSIYFLISGILTLIFIGILGMGILVILWIIFAIKAAMAAHEGKSFRYPMTIRFIK